MKDTYGGESPGKKPARLAWWLHIAQSGAVPWGKARIMVLAGRDGSDARVIRALGADMSRVIMVDYCAEALASASAKVPGVATFHGTDIEAAQAYRGKVDVVAMDYCDVLSPDAIRRFARVTSLALRPTGGIAACGMMYGREGKGTEAAAAVASARDRRPGLYTGEMAAVMRRAAKRGALEACGFVQDLSVLQNREARIDVWRSAARFAFGGVGMRYEEVASRFYVSRKKMEGEKKKGATPMVYLVGKAKRGKGYALRPPVALGRGSVPGTTLLDVRSFTGAHADPEIIEATRSGVAWLRALAVDLAREHGSRAAAELLALDDYHARRVPAWLAVDTRENRKSA